jgi:hypothetical protein
MIFLGLLVLIGIFLFAAFVGVIFGLAIGIMRFVRNPGSLFEYFKDYVAAQRLSSP